MLTRAPSAGKPIETSRVRDAILKFGLGESATVERVADALGVSPRSLQRRLEEEACTFSRLREETIREAALTMLVSEDSPVEEVAFRLGFSSRTAFHRAIRRWTGKAPGALRGKSAMPPRS
jgi:AraC-like DNA-binding protein